MHTSTFESLPSSRTLNRANPAGVSNNTSIFSSSDIPEKKKKKTTKH